MANSVVIHLLSSFTDAPGSQVRALRDGSRPDFAGITRSRASGEISLAGKAADAAAALFAGGMNGADVPSFEVTADILSEDARVTTLLVKSGLCKSQSEARNQLKAGAVFLGDEKIIDFAAAVTADMIGPDGLMLKKGKKGFRRLVLA